MAGAPHIDDTCLDGNDANCRRWAIDGFSSGLARARAGAGVVRVSYYGDSVVSTDAIPGRVRSRLQALVGDGGPGFVWAALPHRFCHNEIVALANSGRWQSYGVSTIAAPDGLYGVSGGSEVEKYIKGSGLLESKRHLLRLDVMSKDSEEGRLIDGIKRLIS